VRAAENGRDLAVWGSASLGTTLLAEDWSTRSI